ncbi:MAG TPA: hypothetical protein DGT23_08655 [Micromonosporaceae bacterium]|nr:hypothetical protein [Micromonosporaceae bacterium]
MTTASTTHGATATLSSRIIAGVAGGLVGGIMFGILMQMMDMIGMVAMLVNSKSIAVGWLVHLFNSALFGAIFAVVFGRWANKLVPAIGIGLVYGVIWWVLGALLIMPAWLGMNDMIFKLTTTAWQSLMGHLLYGLLLGVVYAVVRPRLQRS